MKRIIARFGVTNEERESCNSASSYNAFIGRQFVISGRTIAVEKLIAEGGFGVVFKARDLSHRCFALKRICVNNQEDLLRCQQEVNILRSVVHKNIIRLVDSSILQDHNGIFEVLMLLHYCRDTVSDMVKESLASRSSLKEPTVLRILCDMCEAVGCLHQNNIIHRDLKLENILIDEAGHYVLCDFGSATRQNIKPSVYGRTKTEEEIAKYTTLAYRAPEMVNLYMDMEISAKSDIWALGCLLYTLCFLKLPFKDSALAIQSGEYSVPDYHDYGENILKLIAYALKVDPSTRPDIYQVSVLAFRMTAECVTPLRNTNNASVPAFDELPLPTSESDATTLKSKQSSKISASVPLCNSEPVKTSVTPRQRPRVCGPSINNLSQPAVHSRGQSAETLEEDVYSVPPPPQVAENGRSTRNTAAKEESTSSVSQSPENNTNSSSSVNPTADNLISLTPENVEKLFDDSFFGPIERHCSDPTDAKTSDAKPSQTLGNFSSLRDLDLLSFDAPQQKSQVKQPTNFNISNPSSGLVMGQPRPVAAVNSRVGHRRLLSDTSVIAGFNQVRPPIRVSQAPQWKPPRLDAPSLQQPLTASVSMDYIRFAGMIQNQLPQGSYQYPPYVRMSQPQQLMYGSPNYMNPSTFQQNVAQKPSGDPQNPHHQWRHPLRGNRQLWHVFEKESSSSADLMNLVSSKTTRSDQVDAINKQMNHINLDSTSNQISMCNNRTSSALQLDAFGSIPFSSMSIPPRLPANQGHTRSASHGQFFPKT